MQSEGEHTCLRIFHFVSLSAKSVSLSLGLILSQKKGKIKETKRKVRKLRERKCDQKADCQLDRDAGGKGLLLSVAKIIGLLVAKE